MGNFDIPINSTTIATETTIPSGSHPVAQTVVVASRSTGSAGELIPHNSDAIALVGVTGPTSSVRKLSPATPLASGENIIPMKKCPLSALIPPVLARAVLRGYARGAFVTHGIGASLFGRALDGCSRRLGIIVLLPAILKPDAVNSGARIHKTGDIALVRSSAWDAAVPTPLGPLPRAPRGCNVAAPRCRRRGLGRAVANPPPLARGWLPMLCQEFKPFGTRPRPEILRQRVRGSG